MALCATGIGVLKARFHTRYFAHDILFGYKVYYQNRISGFVCQTSFHRENSDGVAVFSGYYMYILFGATLTEAILFNILVT